MFTWSAREYTCAVRVIIMDRNYELQRSFFMEIQRDENARPSISLPLALSIEIPRQSVYCQLRQVYFYFLVCLESEKKLNYNLLIR